MLEVVIEELPGGKVGFLPVKIGLLAHLSLIR